MEAQANASLYGKGFKEKRLSLVNLHYANLPDLEISADWLMKNAFYELNDYVRFIRFSRQSMWQSGRLKKVRWKPALLGAKVTAGKRSHLLDDRTGFWVKIEELDQNEGIDVIEEFCNAESVIEHPDRGAPRIRILDSDFERGLLKLNSGPKSEEHVLYLPPSEYVLVRQERALERLRECPEPWHRGLLRLVQNVQQVEWPQVSTPSHVQWEFLTDSEIEGTDEQRRFVEIALGTPDFAVLEGPPGSGKTTTICELIIQEIRMGHRVILCASTHVAVDNVLEFLQNRGSTSSEVVAVRIGDQRRISEKTKDFQLQIRAKKEREDLIKKLLTLPSRTDAQKYFLESLQDCEGLEDSPISRIVLQSANLVCGTTIGILQHPDIMGRVNGAKKNGEEVPRRSDVEVPKFDCLILDEASKTTFQEFLVPSMFARRWILVGDVRQLSPYVENENVEENIKPLLEEEDAGICLDTFHCWDSSKQSVRGLLLVDCPNSEKYIAQANELGLYVLNLTDTKRSADPLDFLGAHIIVCHKEDLPKIENMLPPDMKTLPTGGTRAMERRYNYWRAYHAQEVDGHQVQDMSSKWSKEIAWRLVRTFELRDADTETRYKQEIVNLLPRWINAEELEHLQFNLETVKRVALPSVLELLQKGFGRRTQGAKGGSSLTDGLPFEVLSQRYVRLSYQHRMHPEISKFPRERIYESDSLKDPSGILEEREWSYGRYKGRAGWIQTVGGRSHNQEMNENEAQIIMRELDAFVRWASTHPKDAGKRRQSRWSVAVITFYRRQETLLRGYLQKRFGQDLRTYFEPHDGSSEIILCTVDRFQGHEADLVFVSFCRSRGVGFLDSPNRLNVAITRPRYQLVLVGNRNMFANTLRATFLRELARDLSVLSIAWGSNK